VPWSALTKFDDDVVAAAARYGSADVAQLATMLKTIVETVAPLPAS
jgi:hypothetical protein